MTDLEKAKEIFQKENCTLVLCKGDDVFTSDQTGIKKLVELAEGDKDFSDYSACDKIVGRAAAFLYVLLGVKHVHATVMAKLAIQILDRAEITSLFSVSEVFAAAKVKLLCSEVCATHK